MKVTISKSKNSESFYIAKALLIIREKVLLLMFVNSEPLKNFCWNMGLHGMMS